MERIVNILVIDDDMLDAMDLRRTLDKMNIVYKMDIVRNGEEALNFLENKSHAGEKLPDVTLIDINMPKMNGLEFLSVIRSSEKYKDLKCFMLTTSDEKVDKEAAKDLNVSGYIVKPFKTTTHSSLDSFHLMIDLMNA